VHSLAFREFRALERGVHLVQFVQALEAEMIEEGGGRAVQKRPAGKSLRPTMRTR